MSSMSYFRICSMRSIQKTTFCGFIALLNKVLDFGGQLVNKLSFILAIIPTRSYFCCSNFWLPASWDVCRKFLFLLSIPAHDEHVTRQVTVNNFEQTHTLLLPRQHSPWYKSLSGSNGFTLSQMQTCSPDQCWFSAFRRTKSPIRL